MIQILISKNETIKQIKINNNNKIKLNQFANDSTLILDGTMSSFQATLNILEIFGTLSGLKVNTDKMQIVKKLG